MLFPRPGRAAPASIALLALLVGGCVGGPATSVPAGSATQAAPADAPGSPATGSASAVAGGSATAPADGSASAGAPDWFDFELVDVVTGEAFTINDFAGKVVLVETMAQWCPTCRSQQDEVAKLHGLLGASSDLVSVSIDIDLNEDAPTLKVYAAKQGYDWRMAVATKPLAHALDSEYGTQYLNPPSAPMLFVDRNGTVHTLRFGVKSAEDLRATLAPFLGF